MEKNDLTNVSKCVVIGGSAGCLKVLMHILQELHPSLGFPLIIVIHRKNDRKSSLDQLLTYRTALIVNEVEDKVMLENGKSTSPHPTIICLLKKIAFFRLMVPKKFYGPGLLLM